MEKAVRDNAVDSTPGPETPALAAKSLVVGYGTEPVLHGVEVSIPAHTITALVGPNGCGKSTLVKTLAQQLTPTSGSVWVGDTPASTYSARQFARHVSFLPQQPVVPEGISVRDLIGFGRYPYTGAFARLTRADYTAIEHAAARTGVSEVLDAPATELSGGQRQRAWMAMTLAQEAPILLLDEPTTYLDPAHQLQTLNLIHDLRTDGKTVVMVLHDMTHAARFADRVIAMKDGRVYAAGTTTEILTPELVTTVFGVGCLMVEDPETGRKLPVPHTVR